MIRAVFRGLLVCLLLASFCSGETLDEAVRNLAKKLSVRLAPPDAPRVSVRNLSILGGAEAARARAVFARALRPDRPKAAQPVEVTLTISQNSREYLLIAELFRNGDRVVEIQPWRPDAQPPHAMQVALARHLLWEQDDPILDLLISGDRMLVLEPTNLVAYSRRASGWERTDSRTLDGAPALRDRRGRLQVDGSSLTAFLPGITCHGSWQAALDVLCEPASAAFVLDRQQVTFTPARNTLDAEGWTPFFSIAQLDERSRPLWLLAQPDGRTHLYNAARKASGEIDSWGDDFVQIENGCAKELEILAAAPGERDLADSLTAFEIADRKPVQTSDAVDLPGPVLALWPADAGALAIVRNTVSGHYAAYLISIDCSR